MIKGLTRLKGVRYALYFRKDIFRSKFIKERIVIIGDLSRMP